MNASIAPTAIKSTAGLSTLPGLKGRQQAAWSSGDYAVVGSTLQIVGELLAEACNLNWDERVLEVAAGNGNATLAAARRGSRVTSTDYVAALLDRAAARARAEHLEVTFEVADAEALPYEDASFDAVLSTLFSHKVANIAVTSRLFNFRYRSPAHFIEIFRSWYGPVHKAFTALPADRAATLEHDLTDLLNTFKSNTAGALVVPSEYLEVVITRR